MNIEKTYVYKSIRMATYAGYSFPEFIREAADLTFWQNGVYPKKGKGLPFSAKEQAPRCCPGGLTVKA